LGRRRPPAPAGRHGLRAVLAEELLRALGDRQQPHHALLRLDDAAFPLGQLDAERLREAAHHVEDQREALGLAAGGALLVVVLNGRLLVLNLVAFAAALSPSVLWRVHRKSAVSRASSSTAPAAPLRALASAVPSTCASALRPTTSQTFSRYSASVTSRPLGGLDLRVAAEDLERRPDAGKHEVGAAHAFALQALHPVADPLRGVRAGRRPSRRRARRRGVAGR
jgi:hypothetical protein